MADDRMVLICSVCHKALAIAKFYGSWSCTDDRVHGLTAFLQRHQICMDGVGPQYPFGFGLGFESDGGEWEYEA